jgi:hypothetical protein
VKLARPETHDDEEDWDRAEALVASGRATLPPLPNDSSGHGAAP